MSSSMGICRVIRVAKLKLVCLLMLFSFYFFRIFIILLLVQKRALCLYVIAFLHETRSSSGVAFLTSIQRYLKLCPHNNMLLFIFAILFFFNCSLSYFFVWYILILYLFLFYRRLCFSSVINNSAPLTEMYSSWGTIHLVFSCYTVYLLITLVDMFVEHLVKIDRIIWSPALHIDRYVKQIHSP